MPRTFKSIHLKFLVSWLIIISCSEPKPPKISKIEHVYVRTENAREQFVFFTEELKLPIVWDYENYGDFTSGGISLGNLVLELIDANHSERPHAFGIALKPTPDLQSVILSLDSVGIQYDDIHLATNWDLLSLQGLLPNEINLFICDYKNWNSVEKERTEAANALQAANGGSLGIASVKQVIINQRQFRELFEKLPGILRTSGNSHFEDGPAILWNDSSTYPFGLVILVNSLEATKTLLDQKAIEYHLTERGLEIFDEQFQLEIILVEN